MVLKLSDLASLHYESERELSHPVDHFRIGSLEVDTDYEPVIMGVVNLSRESTYRESVAPSHRDAIRKARILFEQGAQLIDLGAESSRADAPKVESARQIETLIPLIRELAEAGVPTSIESYAPEVIHACLEQGAAVINLTGTKNEDQIYELVASYDRSLIMCFTPGENVRDNIPVKIHEDPIPALVEHFGPRLERARALGVRNISIDPGLGFHYGIDVDPIMKAQHQAQVLLHSGRLRVLGAPVCQIMPHAFDLFQEEFRIAEAIYTVLAHIGAVGILRVHEVARVAAALRMLAAVSVRPTFPNI